MLPVCSVAATVSTSSRSVARACFFLSPKPSSAGASRERPARSQAAPVAAASAPARPSARATRLALESDRRACRGTPS